MYLNVRKQIIRYVSLANYFKLILMRFLQRYVFYL